MKGLGSEQNGDNAVQEAAERAIVDLVRVRQKEVKRLKGELQRLKAHAEFLYRQFSEPAFPLGYNTNTKRFENTPVDSVVPVLHGSESPVPEQTAADNNNALILYSSDNPSENEGLINNDDNNNNHPYDYSHREKNRDSRKGSSLSQGSGKKKRSSERQLHQSGISRSKQPSSQSDSSSLDPKNRTPEVSSSQPSTSSSSDTSSEGDSSQGKVQVFEKNSAGKNQPAEQTNPKNISIAEKHSEVIQTAKYGPTAVMPLTTWQPKQVLVLASSESGSSSSSDEENTQRKTLQKQTHICGAGGRGRIRPPRPSRAAVAASPAAEAPPEDHFDWTVLGFQGPWIPLSSTHENASEPIAQIQNQSPLVLRFSSTSDYITSFKGLVLKEAKAFLLTNWDEYVAEQNPDVELKDLSTQGVIVGQTTERGMATRWNVQGMIQTPGDPFHYMEVRHAEGPNLKLDIGELLGMMVPETKQIKALAIVYSKDRTCSAVLRARAAWDSSLGQCVLVRISNMVTLCRMFVSVSSIGEMFSPLQRQLLDPMSCKQLSPAIIQCSFQSLETFKVCKILNSTQLMAVSALLSLRQGFLLVQGPPGTGKTSAIVGMISSLLIEEAGVRVLVCAPSNAALDELVARLMHRMLDKAGDFYTPVAGSLVRFGSKKLMHPDVQSVSLDQLSARLSTTSAEHSRSWVDILEGASIVCATLSGCGQSIFDELSRPFDVVIIDEAVQAVEAEVLIALKRVKGRCVLVGDPCQLPATVFQRPATAFLRSLFERLQEAGVPVHFLRTQYRMHPEISQYPSQRFYNAALKNSLQTRKLQSIFNEEEKVVINGSTLNLGHYCFVDVGWGIEQEEAVGHSRSNYEEAQVVCSVIEGVTKALKVGCKPNMGVITPYIAQRGLIERQLEERGIDGIMCEVNTVDGFQGREKDVILLSCVRAMANRGLGFVSDERRMNVALTRARFALIIVGHAETLRQWSPVWGTLIDDAHNRGCYQILTKGNRRKKSFIRQKVPDLIEFHKDGGMGFEGEEPVLGERSKLAKPSPTGSSLTPNKPKVKDEVDGGDSGFEKEQMTNGTPKNNKKKRMNQSDKETDNGHKKQRKSEIVKEPKERTDLDEEISLIKEKNDVSIEEMPGPPPHLVPRHDDFDSKDVVVSISKTPLGRNHTRWDMPNEETSVDEEPITGPVLPPRNSNSWRRNLHLPQNEHASAAGRSWDPKTTPVRSDSVEVGIWRPEASGEKQICMTNSAACQKDYTNCKDSKGVRDAPNTIAHVLGESFAKDAAQLKVGESCARNPPHLDYNTNTKVMEDKYHVPKSWEHEQIYVPRYSSGPGPSQGIREPKLSYWHKPRGRIANQLPWKRRHSDYSRGHHPGGKWQPPTNKGW
ncbi:hypothetical protein CY35_04G135600 [Sphagnum magellanicum]|nr:hypothetical protein CY35_04G135600 [Sphagnum magellanicum]